MIAKLIVLFFHAAAATFCRRFGEKPRFNQTISPSRPAGGMGGGFRSLPFPIFSTQMFHNSDRENF
jgi:hypothetical protein